MIMADISIQVSWKNSMSPVGDIFQQLEKVAQGVYQNRCLNTKPSNGYAKLGSVRWLEGPLKLH